MNLSMQVLVRTRHGDQASTSIFCVGDCADFGAAIEKHQLNPHSPAWRRLAFTAENQGHIVAENIFTLHQVACNRIDVPHLISPWESSFHVRGNDYPLKQYPSSLSQSFPTVLCISIGCRDAILVFQSLVVPGRLASLGKALIESTKVSALLAPCTFSLHQLTKLHRFSWPQRSSLSGAFSVASSLLWRFAEPVTFAIGSIFS